MKSWIEKRFWSLYNLGKNDGILENFESKIQVNFKFRICGVEYVRAVYCTVMQDWIVSYWLQLKSVLGIESFITVYMSSACLLCVTQCNTVTLVCACSTVRACVTYVCFSSQVCVCVCVLVCVRVYLQYHCQVPIRK